MLESLPKRAFLQFEIPIHFLAKTPLIDGGIRKWDERHRLPALVELEGEEPFADVYAAWNDEGFMAAFDVTGRRGPLHCDPDDWWKQDGLRLCIDSRDARDVRRATRFCHFFYFLPLGGGRGGKQPVAGVHKMNRAKELHAPIDATEIKVAAQVHRTGYSLETFIPAGCLTGWSPAEHPRIGVFYKVKDSGRGDQHLSATDEFGWNVDPSTWATGVLVR